MIQNEREYRITRARADTFTHALEECEEYGGADPLLVELNRSALTSKLDDLREELSEYEALKSGMVREIAVASLDELPAALIRARVATGLSQRDLAERLGVKEQQIQRYESTAYAGASLTRLTEVTGALGLRITGTLLLHPDASGRP